MLIAALAQYFFGISIFLTSIFLIMLVLVQRGRGGGLTGALGGPGGQSAFGTKAGDLFTRITVGVATVWIFLCASAVFFLKARGLPTIAGPASMGATDIGATKIDDPLSNLDSGTPLKQPPADLLNSGGLPSGGLPSGGLPSGGAALNVGDVPAEATDFPALPSDVPPDANGTNTEGDSPTTGDTPATTEQDK